MKALFFGTSSFAVPSLRVTAARTRLAGVVTQPDRPAGRGQRPTPSPVKRAALDLALGIYEPLSLRDFTREMAAETFDLFVLASYGRILPQGLLEQPRLGALNVHPSLLPKYRGATPIQAALRNGDPETGVTIMLMDAGMDTGDVVLQEQVRIEPGETYGELHDRLALIGASLLERALVSVERDGSITHRPQTGLASTTRPIGREDLTIDWSWNPKTIVDHVRAFSPQPAARAMLHGELVKILRAHLNAEGEVEIDQLIAPNRGRMSGAEYMQSRK
ncbi:MAG: methionyl-tRNA formyltransferase [Candidatus Eremiobacteraeota bacterium]|nr:methionyl-tRNA formyltransferase [Candidatus Eremiobacteraeota bacterium]MBV8374779.1 methionyl-tRNA formyltransferase [Candidatus Eremiobacteraeota bacterium]